ncbi:MAG: RHS repeat-associated core domain-containing protein, partial [Methanobacteriota archaeon]
GKVLRGMNLGLGAEETKYKFSANELDVETNLSYFGARYYDGEIARWWSVDPLGDVAIAQSPFTYVNNNPLNLIDIGGLFPQELGQENKSKKDEDETYPFIVPYTGPPIIITPQGEETVPTQGVVFFQWRPGRGAYYDYRPKNNANHSWAVRWFGPPATSSDPWWWQVFRGTGNLEQDVQSFFYGMWGITLASVGGAVGSGYIVANATLIKIKLISTSIVARNLAGRAVIYMTRVGHGIKFFYYRNALQINDKILVLTNLIPGLPAGIYKAFTPMGQKIEQYIEMLNVMQKRYEQIYKGE